MRAAKMWRAVLALAASLLAGAAAADEPPVIEHQPVPCTIPSKLISICASVTDDGQVAKARVYFHAAGDDYFSFVEMVFQGLNYCATLPAPKEGKVKAIDYYIQAVDDQYQTQRTSTYQMNVQSEAVCGFPPVLTDKSRATGIMVYATHKKQGKKLPDVFEESGVSFVPVAAGK